MKLVENSENDRGSVCDCDNEVLIEDCLLSHMLDCLPPLMILSLYSVFCQQNGNGTRSLDKREDILPLGGLSCQSAKHNSVKYLV